MNFDDDDEFDAYISRRAGGAAVDPSSVVVPNTARGAVTPSVAAALQNRMAMFDDVLPSAWGKPTELTKP